ncbi:DUF4258 domain-containing protein [Brevibacillus porteri]|uniref:DUF4258 domain-containing protein n=1 Tax=Brevibacillus porteri TaxID=2126350 RepID=UPI00362ED43A
MQLLIMKHVRERMAERCITHDDVVTTIQNGHVVEAKEGRSVYTHGIIRVVATVHNNEMIVVFTVTYIPSYNRKAEALVIKLKITITEAYKILRKQDEETPP